MEGEPKPHVKFSRNPFNGIESQHLNRLRGRRRRCHSESIQWNWKLCYQYIEVQKWIVNQRIHSMELKDYAGMSAKQLERIARIHSMELKETCRATAATHKDTESIQWNWKWRCCHNTNWIPQPSRIHSMELKAVWASRTRPVCKLRALNPFNGIESEDAAIILTEYLNPLESIQWNWKQYEPLELGRYVNCGHWIHSMELKVKMLP